MKAMGAKERLDILLVQKNLAPSREKAKALLMAGLVYVNGNKEEKAGTQVEISSAVEVRGKGLKYVSRGGYKLEKAMQEFPISLTGKVCMDVGASTGGFTDCMLQNGAVKVYAVDVGYGQFAWKLRQDERVVCLEKTNVRYLTKEQVPEEVSFSSIDVSFISLTKILPAVLGVMAEEGQLVCLIKPQFEAGREKVGKKGVVREKRVHLEVVQKILSFAVSLGVMVRGISFSPIKGPEGNIEYLLFLDRLTPGFSETEAMVCAESVVNAAHTLLNA